MLRSMRLSRVSRLARNSLNSEGSMNESLQGLPASMLAFAWVPFVVGVEDGATAY
jgi:hypothetical protein